MKISELKKVTSNAEINVCNYIKRLTEKFPSGYANLEKMKSSLYHSQKNYRGQMIASKSTISRFADDPEAWAACKTIPSTNLMVLGSLLDAAILDQDELKNFMPMTFKDFRTKAAQEWKKEIESDGKSIIKEGDYNIINAALKNIAKNNKAMSLLKGATSQVAVFVELQGYPFKVLIDIVPDRLGDFGDGLADLKRTSGFAPKLFRGQIFKFKYHWQAAVYLDAWNAAMKIIGVDDIRSKWYFLISSDSPPFGCGVAELDQEFIQLGREQYKKALHDFAVANKNNEFKNLYDQEEGVFKITL